MNVKKHPRVDPVVRQGAVDLPHTITGEGVLSRLGVDPDQGLTSDQAAHRLTDIGFNRRVQPRRVTFWRVLREEIMEPMILLLLAVAILYSVWGKLEDTVAIIVVIVAVVLVEVFTEYRAKAAIAALSRLSAPTAPVVRGGRIQDVPTEALVPGDLLLLRPGELLAADARLIETAGLRVDESALTGESVSVDKREDIVLAAAAPLGERANLIFAGSTVVAGHGRAVVVATGMATELGRITGLVAEAKPPRTELQQAMRDLARWLAWLALGFSVLVPLIGVLGGQPWREMILTGLTLAFATIPEELPIIISMVLGLGAYRLSRQHALVKRLRAAETLGTVTVVATDKTGTLTENRMIVTHLITDRITDRVESLGNPSQTQQHLLALAAACHDAAVVRHDDTLQVAGDPTDAALLDAAHALRLLPGDPGGVDGILVSVQPFDTRRKIMSVSYRREGGELSLIAKGAPEEILDRCSRRLIGGKALTLTGADRARFRTQLEQLAAEGLRVIAVATRALPDVPASGAPIPADEAERQLTLAGLVGLADPPRPEAAESVRALRQAGIRVLMITGDHPVTARAIASRVGIDDSRPLLTGPRLDELDDAALAELVATTSLFARITPEHKLRLVRALHSRGEIVAVTGDGVNDAPALAEADVGIAMGVGGTDVARDAADLVLADDNFATITRAIREGRQIFDNLRKGVRYYLACKVALIATAAAGVALGLPVPFTPIQIVVMELFMDIVGSATFAAEPAEGDTMNRPPRDSRRRFLDTPMVRSIFSHGATLFAAVTAIYLAASWMGAPTGTAQTLAFVSWMVGHLALAWVMRSERTPLTRFGLRSNRFLPGWSAITAAAVVTMMTVAPLRNALRLSTLTGIGWLIAVAIPLLAVAWIEFAKRHGGRNSSMAPRFLVDSE